MAMGSADVMLGQKIDDVLSDLDKGEVESVEELGSWLGCTLQAAGSDEVVRIMAALDQRVSEGHPRIPELVDGIALHMFQAMVAACSARPNAAEVAGPMVAAVAGDCDPRHCFCLLCESLQSAAAAPLHGQLLRALAIVLQKLCRRRQWPAFLADAAAAAAAAARVRTPAAGGDCPSAAAGEHGEDAAPEEAARQLLPGLLACCCTAALLLRPDACPTAQQTLLQHAGLSKPLSAPAAAGGAAWAAARLCWVDLQLQLLPQLLQRAGTAPLQEAAARPASDGQPGRGAEEEAALGVVLTCVVQLLQAAPEAEGGGRLLELLDRAVAECGRCEPGDEQAELRRRAGAALLHGAVLAGREAGGEAAPPGGVEAAAAWRAAQAAGGEACACADQLRRVYASALALASVGGEWRSEALLRSSFILLRQAAGEAVSSRAAAPQPGAEAGADEELLAVAQMLLLNAMHHPLQHLREDALRTLQELLAAPPEKQQLEVLEELLGCGHAEMCAILLSLLRRRLAAAWPAAGAERSSPFLDRKVAALALTWVQPDGRHGWRDAEALPEVAEPVNAALNLLLFVLLRESAAGTDHMGLRQPQHLHRLWMHCAQPLLVAVQEIKRNAPAGSGVPDEHDVSAALLLEVTLSRLADVLHQNGVDTVSKQTATAREPD